MKYYKEDIAREQIETAIKLFLNDESYIAINTLIHSTKTLLEDLDRKKWIWLRLEDWINPEVSEKEKKAFFFKFNKFANFCKHSRNDEKDYIDSDIQLEWFVEIQIYKCIEMHKALFWDLNNKLFMAFWIYMFYKSEYDFLFISTKVINPELCEKFETLWESLWLIKDNPNLKKNIYTLISNHES